MKVVVRSASGLALALCSFLAFAEPSYGALPKKTHCKPDETIVFSCPSGTRIISVCASKNLSQTDGYIEYRYGKFKALEINFPPLERRAQQYVQARRLMFAKGGGVYLRFNNAPFSYNVYSAFVGGEGPKEGVLVQKNDRDITRHQCTKPMYMTTINGLFDGKVLPDAPDDFVP